MISLSQSPFGDSREQRQQQYVVTQLIQETAGAKVLNLLNNAAVYTTPGATCESSPVPETHIAQA